MKYYYIKSGEKYLDGKENAFYSKMHLGTLSTSFTESEKVRTHCIAQKEVILNDLKARLENIKTNTQEDKKNRINLQKRIEWGTEDLKLYYNSCTVQVEEQKILEAQQDIQMDAVFMGEVYKYFLNDLKYNLVHLTKFSKYQIKAINDNVKIINSNDGFKKMLATNEDVTYDTYEEYLKTIKTVSQMSYTDPLLLNELFEMMQDNQGLATMKRALTNFKKKKNEA